MRSVVWNSSCIMFLLSAVVLSTSCSGCNDVVISEVLSPGGTQKAIVFVRDCGATTGFSTQVSVVSSSRASVSGSGNVFSADDDHGRVKLGGRGELAVHVVWIDDRHLIITFPAHSRVFRRDPQFGRMQIKFVNT